MDRVDWSSLTHAYGPASDVPELIRGLESPDEDVRSSARFDLYSCIAHQGSRYEASAPAVPFLADVVRMGKAPDKHRVVDLIAFIATGSDTPHLPEGIDVELLRSRARWNADAGSARWELAAYEAVARELPLFVDGLGADDYRLRVACAYTLAWFPESAQETLPHLRALVERDPSRYCKATALVSIGLLDGYLGERGYVETLMTHLGDDDRLIRWAAAIALARLSPADSPPAVLDELARWVTGEEDEYPAEDVPFMLGDVRHYAVVSISRFPDGRSEVVHLMLEALARPRGHPTGNMVSELVHVVAPWGARGRPPFEALSPLQRKVLEVLAESPWLWDPTDPSYARPGSILAGWLERTVGGTLAGLRRYVGRPG